MQKRAQIRLNFTLAITASMLLPFAGRADPDTAAEIRRDFHQQGFKTDLSDFNFTVPKEMSDRGDVLTNMTLLRPAKPASFLDNADLLKPVTSNTATVVWSQKTLAKPQLRFEGYFFSKYGPGAETNIWPLERDLLAESAPQLDSAAAAVLSGPFGFDLKAAAGTRMLLPHLRSLQNLSDMFAGRAVLGLHDHNSGATWTNLLVLTRLVTDWQVEPVEISQNIRFRCLQTAYDLTWQALQAGDWSDARLAQLQHEWELLDVFKPLPDTVAFMGASYMADLKREDDPSVPEDEKALLLIYHDRELAMRRAIGSESWTQIQLNPDITNVLFIFPPQTNIPPKLRMKINSGRLALAMSSGGISLVGRTSEAETRRRLIMTAITLERFHLQHGSYPKSLDALIPDFLKTPLNDFMDGQPLHYSLTGDGHFLLYSVGLDGKDDGGQLSLASDERPSPLHPAPRDPDIVWPLPASAEQVSSFAAEKQREQQERDAVIARREADDAAQAEIARQGGVKELLNNPKYQKTTWTKSSINNETVAAGELTYKGQSLAGLLTNEKSSRTNELSPDALFALRLTPIPGQPQYAAFQLPIAYDRLTNLDHPTLELIMDTLPEKLEFNQPKDQGCIRATNGDCLLIWDTSTDRPGLRALQSKMYLHEENYSTDITGPVIPYLSTNLFWFDWGPPSIFDNRGDDLHAQVVESNATFRIEIKTDPTKPPIKTVKTLTGTTSNAVIYVKWDLLDDHGNKVTDDRLEADFTVTLLDSRRSQMLRLQQVRVPNR